MESFIVLKIVCLAIFIEGLNASTECDKMPPGASSVQKIVMMLGRNLTENFIIFPDVLQYAIIQGHRYD